MAFGLPCLTSSKIPYTDLGNNEEDFLVANPDDIAHFSQTLQRLLNDEALRNFLGNNAKKINERLSLEKIGQMFASILH
jgi:glycosyltransferase involved in cell wall biosynthesis